MRTGRPRDKHEAATRRQQPQTPDRFIADDFEPEEIESAAKELAPMLEEERQLGEQERHRSLKWYYDVGKVVAKHYSAVKEERERHGQSMYGERFFQRVADAMNADSANKVSWQLLYECFRLVGTYNEKAYSELCRHDVITPSHALQLGLIGVDEDRSELQEKVLEEGWTVKELCRAIREKYGCRRQPGAGRPLKASKTVKAAVVHLTAQATKFIKANDEIWFGNAFDIPSEIVDMPPDKLTDDLKTRVSEAAKLYDKVAETTQKNAQILRDVLLHIERCMQAQAEYDRRREAEEEQVACATAV